MFKKKNLLLAAVLVVGLLAASTVFASDFDLTKFGLKPAESYDFGGETVTIISWTSERMANYFNDNLSVMGRVEEAEKIFNCKIEWMQTRDIPEVNFNRLLAGESGYDLWHVSHKIGYWELQSANALYPIEDILPDCYFDNLPHIINAIEEALKYKGQRWGIGNVEYRPLYGYIPMTFVAYNKTLFDREGLSDPYDLYVDGKWTWEAATDIAIKATADNDSDGEIDQWGIVDARAWYLAVSNGANITRLDDDKFIFTADEPAFIDALEQLRE